MGFRRHLSQARWLLTPLAPLMLGGGCLLLLPSSDCWGVGKGKMLIIPSFSLFCFLAGGVGMDLRDWGGRYWAGMDGTGADFTGRG